MSFAKIIRRKFWRGTEQTLMQLMPWLINAWPVRKVVDVLSDGGKVEDGDVIERNGFVHQGMMNTLK